MMGFATESDHDELFVASDGIVVLYSLLIKSIWKQVE